MIPLAQWLSIRRVLPSRAHLTVAGDQAAVNTWWTQVDADKYATIERPVHLPITKIFPAQAANSVKPCSSLNYWHSSYTSHVISRLT